MFLLDTMVVSERTKLRPDPRVRRWLNALDVGEQFISAITVGEIRFGVERMPPGSNKTRLEQWLVLELMPTFAGRILPIDLRVADRWGRLRQKIGRSVSAADALIGATALTHNLAVATRNVGDFGDFGLRIVNPWADP